MEDRPSAKQDASDSNNADMWKWFPDAKPHQRRRKCGYADANQVERFDVAVLVAVFSVFWTCFRSCQKWNPIVAVIARGVT